MKITLKNMYLVSTVNFLQSLKLTGTDSLARSKFVKLLMAAGRSLTADECTLINEYGEPEDLTKPVSETNPVHVKSDGAYSIRVSKRSEFQREHTRLLQQSAEIEAGTYAEHVNDLLRILKGYDGELSGDDAIAYMELVESLEGVDTSD